MGRGVEVVPVCGYNCRAKGVMVSGWCPCVPLGRRDTPPPTQQHQSSQHQQQSSQQKQKNRRSAGPFTVSAATERAEMVQMFYYENRGKCCKKLLRYNGVSNKVCLDSCLYFIFDRNDFRLLYTRSGDKRERFSISLSQLYRCASRYRESSS